MIQRRQFLASSACAMAATSGIVLASDRDSSLQDITSPNLSIKPRSSDEWHLTFKLTRGLRILQVTDTHFSSTPKKDQQSLITLDALIREAQPDLIVHTGDFVNNDSSRPVTWDGVDYFNKLKMPWALCFGNHDYPVAESKGSLSLEDFRQSLKNCAMGYTTIDKQRHYCYRHDLMVKKDRPSASLFYFQVGYRSGDRKISDPQLAWFAAQMNADREKNWTAPIIVFVHIPLIEYDTLITKGKIDGGEKNEKVCYDSDTGKSYEAFATSKRVKAVFCGHDHVNNYFGNWNGIQLHYGRISGWGGYGDWARGGRLITINPADGSYTQREIIV
jgi:3',5'-cyclic AMP phosphodiesterase CpdA